MKTLIIQENENLKKIIDSIKNEISENQEEFFNLTLLFLNKIYTLIFKDKPLFDVYPSFKVLDKEIHLIWEKNYNKVIAKISVLFKGNILYQLFIREKYHKDFVLIDNINENNKLLQSIIEL